jgi:hypothetical protein
MRWKAFVAFHRMPRHRSRKIEIYDRVTSISVEPEIWFWLRQAAVEQCSTAKACGMLAEASA